MENIRRNDKVKVICGKDKGKVGEVFKIVGNKVLIKGINVYKKHMKPSKDNPDGGIIDKEMPLDKSNVMHCFGDNNVTSRIGYKFVDNKKVRFLKKNGEILQDKKA